MPEKRQTGPQARRTFHLNRIRSAKSGVLKFWWAAWWAAAELKWLDRRDSATAHEQGTALANQLVAFARGLNDEHHEHLMKQKGGASRAAT